MEAEKDEWHFFWFEKISPSFLLTSTSVDCPFKHPHGWPGKSPQPPAMGQHALAGKETSFKLNFINVTDVPTAAAPVTDASSALKQLSPIDNDHPHVLQLEAPFRWYWEMDDHTMEPYRDDINALLEQGYLNFVTQGKERFQTPPITRFVDDKPQTYTIDYAQNKQINDKTGYSRDIERRKVDFQHSTDGKTWQFLNNSGKWERFDKLVQGQLSAAYNAYVSETGPHSVQMTVPGRPEVYSFNFATSKQSNTQSGTERMIRFA